MTDALTQLALAMHHGPGRYALLLGSGVSRAAQIPTGWEIVEDLVRQLAVASGTVVEGDPRSWFKDAYGEEPDYSSLIERLGGTASERNGLLRHYFEPTEEEREQGIKLPTKAHRAIAEMVAAEYVRVIVTTNFDRLLEQALEDAGVRPQVLSTADAASGALPLTHAPCTVIKLHGDYLDTRVRNTGSELASYEPAMDALLDRIFDEFGLVVAGWSGEWDEALRRAILRCPTRRFTTYWLMRSALADEAERIVEHRVAEVIPGLDAEQFFTRLWERLQSLRDLGARDALSDELAVATLKRYLPDPTQRIRLRDLLAEETEILCRELLNPRFGQAGQPTAETIRARIADYEAVTARLEKLAAVLAYWAEGEQVGLLVEMLERVANAAPYVGGYTIWSDMMFYPAARILYSASIGAIAGGRYATVARLITAHISQGGEDRPAYRDLPAFRVIGQDTGHALEGLERHKTPGSERLFDTLRPSLQELLPSGDRYEYSFDLFETILALRNAEGSPESQVWLNPGRYSWNYGFRVNLSPFGKLQASAAADPSAPIFKSGLVSPSLVTSLAATMQKHMEQQSW